MPSPASETSSVRLLAWSRSKDTAWPAWPSCMIGDSKSLLPLAGDTEHDAASARAGLIVAVHADDGGEGTWRGEGRLTTTLLTAWQ